MSKETDEQTVAVESDESAAPTSEDSSAQDLDSLLAEFESGLSDSDTSDSANSDSDKNAGKQGEQPDDDVKSAVEYVKNMRQEDIRRRTNESLDKAVDTIQGNLTGDLPRRAVKGILYEIAETNQKFVSAFQSREQNPEAWNKVLEAVASEINKDLEQAPDANLTSERQALASAVRSASSRAPKADEVPDFGRMSDAELQEYKRNADRAAK